MMEPLSNSSLPKGIIQLEDPFESIWLKSGALVAFIFQVLGSLIMLAFITYEMQGYAGPTRTVLNQLVSHFFIMGVVYVFGPLGIDVIRIWYGPLPDAICETSIIAKNVVCITVLLLMVAIAFIKFLFICIWKNMQQIDDNIAKPITKSIILVSLLAALIKSATTPDEYIMNRIICTGRFNPSELENITRKPIPTYEVIAALAFLSYTGLSLAITFQRCKIHLEEKKMCQVFQQKLEEKSLESLVLKFAIMSTMLATAHCVHITNGSDPTKVGDGLNWFYPYFNWFIAPFMVISFTAIKIIVVNGKDIHRMLFGTNVLYPVIE